MKFTHRRNLPTSETSPRGLAAERATDRILQRLNEVTFQGQLIVDQFFAEIDQREQMTQRGDKN